MRQASHQRLAWPITGLDNPEVRKALLNETIADGNMEAFLLALKNIVEARKPVQQVMQDAEISRQNLHRLLSGSDNSTLETLASVLHAVGLTIDFRPIGEVTVCI